jgi:hypothetical protein
MTSPKSVDVTDMELECWEILWWRKEGRVFCWDNKGCYRMWKCYVELLGVETNTQKLMILLHDKSSVGFCYAEEPNTRRLEMLLRKERLSLKSSIFCWRLSLVLMFISSAQVSLYHDFNERCILNFYQMIALVSPNLGCLTKQWNLLRTSATLQAAFNNKTSTTEAIAAYFYV